MCTQLSWYTAEIYLRLGCVLRYNFTLHSFGFVEYRTVDEAKAVFDNPEDIVLDGNTLLIDYGKVNHLRPVSYLRGNL